MTQTGDAPPRAAYREQPQDLTARVGIEGTTGSGHEDLGFLTWDLGFGISNFATLPLCNFATSSSRSDPLDPRSFGRLAVAKQREKLYGHFQRVGSVVVFVLRKFAKLPD
jgi:hypothetical protein